MINPNTVYRLSERLAGIRLSRQNSENGAADCLPAGSTITIIGPSHFYDMLEVRSGTEVFALFEEDIHNRGELARIEPSHSSTTACIER